MGSVTHDELLERVQYNQGYQMGLDGYKICSALGSVVELHKPDFMGCCDNNCCGSDACTSCLNEYPCPTIQAIEKELG